MSDQKTPEQTLKDLEIIAERAVKDAEIVRAYVALQKRLNTTMPATQQPKSSIEIKKPRGRKPKYIRGEGKGAVIAVMSENDGWMKSRDIVMEVKKRLSKKPDKDIERIVRDTLSKDKKRKKQEIEIKKASDSGRDLMYKYKKEGV